MRLWRKWVWWLRGCLGVGGGAGTAEADLIIRHSAIQAPPPPALFCPCLPVIILHRKAAPASSSSLASSVGQEEGESCGRIYQQRIECASIGAGSEGCLTAPDNMALAASQPLTPHHTAAAAGKYLPDPRKK